MLLRDSRSSMCHFWGNNNGSHSQYNLDQGIQMGSENGQQLKRWIQRISSKRTKEQQQQQQQQQQKRKRKRKKSEKAASLR
ncbi:hypothetical protein KQI74_19710 [Paenibacillus barcinonensis]|uniref:hypothetical protein n=1 Tax=Paenibacillus barcinonensis TaxID=198119 RepID=UPI001C116E62|nr:hypothetical protein [Paenibacillus barcinonensis]MBU5354523.1 hypothetical protein [Paenibacillus barcinonensis]